MTIDNDLKKVAEIFWRWEQFPSLEAAEKRLSDDYGKGYPTDEFIEGVLRAHKENCLVSVELTAEGNYHFLRKKK